MMYKKVILIIFTANIFCSYEFAAEQINIVSIQQKQVLNYKKIIAKQMLRTRCARIGVQSVMIGMTVFQLYRFYQLLFASSPAIKPDVNNNPNVPNQPAQQKPSWGQWAKGIGTDFKQWVTNKHTWYNIALSGAELSAMIAAQRTADYITQHVFQPDTIFWFMATQAPYPLVLAELQGYALIVDDASEQYESLIGSTKKLVVYGEKINAFMEYKLPYLSLSKRKEALISINALVAGTHNLVSEIENCINAESSLESLVPAIRTTAGIYDRELLHFARLEGSLMFDQQQMNMYVQQLQSQYTGY